MRRSPGVSTNISRRKPIPTLTSFAKVCAELDRRRHVTLGFERIEALLDAMGHPERDIPNLVQVVGTNGKGTTAVALASALVEMGYPSGAYLSPHVLSYTERVVVRGRQVSEEEFAAAMGETIDLADRHGIPVSQFEILTAGTLGVFAEAGLSWAVLEAGLGARYDATSVAGSDAVVLTNVSLDHTEYLGETVEEITAEKLASLRPGATLFLGTDDRRVVDIASRECHRLGASLVQIGDEREGMSSLVPYAARDVHLGLAVAEHLLDRTIPAGIQEKVAHDTGAALPGRFEAHEVDGVPVVVDGGHNAAGVAAAVAAVRSAYGRRPLGVVFGVLREKDAASMLKGLGGDSHVIVLTRPESERACDPALVEREHGPLDGKGRRALIVHDPVEALGVAVEAVRDVAGVILVTGSLSTAAPVLRRLREA
ncbi:MAG TPA: cyanophycin synthetase [Rubrobacter sp.]|nr:cyanophycin synthetase [Rubrobacter sp.]